MDDAWTGAIRLGIMLQNVECRFQMLFLRCDRLAPRYTRSTRSTATTVVAGTRLPVAPSCRCVRNQNYYNPLTTVHSCPCAACSDTDTKTKGRRGRLGPVPGTITRYHGQPQRPLQPLSPACGLWIAVITRFCVCVPHDESLETGLPDLSASQGAYVPTRGAEGREEKFVRH
jgi:hypothetical protein